MSKKKKKSKILDEASLPLHFKEMIDKVKNKQNLKLEDITEFYLVDLLSRFILSANLFPQGEERSLEQPLAMQLYQALEKKSLEEKVAILKKMGDFALYISGFFHEYLGNKSVDIDYYISMGTGAYGAASKLTEPNTKKEVLSKLFKELSDKFKRIVDLLAEVSELSFISSDKDLMRIYEKWVKTKSPRLKKKLVEMGIFPVFRKTDDKSN